VLRPLRTPKRALVPLGVLGALVVSLPAGAAGSKSFTDPAGDSGSGPDITSVVVSNDDNGVITFSVGFANRSELMGNDRLLIALDVDRNGQTGTRGLDYAIQVQAAAQAVSIGRWNGTEFRAFRPQTLSATNTRTLRIDHRELEGTRAFNFLVVAADTPAPSPVFDEAPDGDRVWTYELAFRPSVSGEVAARFEPAAPRAGTTFAVRQASVPVSTGGTVVLSSPSCRATVAGKRLRPLGRCRWRIPRGARGKILVVVVEGGLGEDRVVSEPFRFRIR
jgi:hypothetical protein